jgi:transposase-like protein
MSENEPEVQRWTAKRKMAVILGVLKNQVNSVEACRKYGIKQSELEEWTERFLSGGENGLRSNPRDDQAQHEAEIKELHAKVGELVLERDILNKRWTQIQESREKRS